MKTFIWNTEYEVYAATADDVKHARYLLSIKFRDNSLDFLIDEKDKGPILDRTADSVPAYVYYRAQSVMNNNLRDFLFVFEHEPDIILNEKEAVIYTHANE